MANTLEKFIDKLPIWDGSFRRRLIAGGVVTLTLLILFWPEEFRWEEYSALFSSPFVALVAAVLVYTLGGIVEMVGELFLVRAVGEIVWLVGRGPQLKAEGKRIQAVFVIPLAMVLWPYYLLRGMSGITNYHAHFQSMNLSDSAKMKFNDLSSRAQDGLLRPLSDNFDFAWKELADGLSEKDQQWLRRKESRKREILSILSAGAFVLGVVMYQFTTQRTFLYSTMDNEFRLIDEHHRQEHEKLTRKRDSLKSIIKQLKHEREEIYEELKGRAGLSQSDEQTLKSKYKELDTRLIEKNNEVDETVDAMDRNKRALKTKMREQERQAEAFILLIATFAYGTVGMIVLTFRGFFLMLNTAIVDGLELLARTAGAQRRSDT